MILARVWPHVSTCTGPDVLRAARDVHEMRGASLGEDTAGPVCVAGLADRAVCEGRPRGSRSTKARLVTHGGSRGGWPESERVMRLTERRYGLMYRPNEGDEHVVNRRPGDARLVEPCHEYTMPGQDVANIIGGGKGALVRGRV